MLTNTGAIAKGVFTINWFLNSSPSLNGSQILIATTPKRIGLNTGKQARLTQAIRSLPASLAAGNYYLIVEMTDPTKAVNIVVSPSTITLAAPFVSISESLSAVTPTSIASGRSGSIVVTLTSSGNITAAGKLTLILNPSANGVTSPLALATLQIKTSIPVGKSRAFRVRMTAPALLATGSYVPVLSGTFDGQTLSAMDASPFIVS